MGNVREKESRDGHCQSPEMDNVRVQRWTLSRVQRWTMSESRDGHCQSPEIDIAKVPDMDNVRVQRLTLSRVQRCTLSRVQRWALSVEPLSDFKMLQYALSNKKGQKR